LPAWCNGAYKQDDEVYHCSILSCFVLALLTFHLQ
jgi:hypothetical protein